MPGAVAPVRKLPGLEIRIWRGPAPQPSDTRTPLGEGIELFTSSQARAVLENLQIARAPRGDESKTLSSEELERWLDRYLRIFGTSWLDKLLQQAEALPGPASRKNSIISSPRSRGHDQNTGLPLMRCGPALRASLMTRKPPRPCNPNGQRTPMTSASSAANLIAALLPRLPRITAANNETQPGTTR